PAITRWRITRSRSRSARESPATTDGSASFPAPPASRTVTAARCRRWAGWTDTWMSLRSTGANSDLPLRRIAVIWLVLSVIGVLAVVFGLEPHMPPGADTAQAHEQRVANTVI